ncbi:hypothetical protein J6R97_08855 [bacterium]|nr:hypothetical protein [bacterium]
MVLELSTEDIVTDILNKNEILRKTEFRISDNSFFNLGKHLSIKEDENLQANEVLLDNEISKYTFIDTVNNKWL